MEAAFPGAVAELEAALLGTTGLCKRSARAALSLEDRVPEARGSISPAGRLDPEYPRTVVPPFSDRRATDVPLLAERPSLIMREDVASLKLLGSPRVALLLAGMLGAALPLDSLAFRLGTALSATER